MCIIIHRLSSTRKERRGENPSNFPLDQSCIITCIKVNFHKLNISILLSFTQHSVQSIMQSSGAVIEDCVEQIQLSAYA